MKIELKKTYVPSKEIVTRVIEGELIIIPLTAGIGDLEDELYALNETGRVIWERLDGQKELSDIVFDLSREYQGDQQEIEEDISGLISELLKRGLIRELSVKG
jgi:hypothetical protein